MSVQTLTFGEIRERLKKSFPNADLSLISSFVNERYRVVARRLDWTDLKLQAVIQTIAPYETGTVDVTQGSTAIAVTALSGGVWSTAMDGRGIRIAGGAEYYQFTSASATTGNLDRGYEGATAVGAPYRIFQNIYPLPLDCRLITTMRVFGEPRDMDESTQESLDELAPNRPRYGVPRFYARHMLDLSVPPRKQVEVYPIPDKVLALPFWYVQDPQMFDSASTASQIPVWFDPTAIFVGVEADVRRIVDRDYAAAQVAETLFLGAVAGLAAQEAAQRPAGHIRPAQRLVAHRKRRWMR